MNLQKKLNTTTIYVTHDQVEAMTMGDRIAVMDKGQVEQIGTPIEIYKNPKSKFVAGFIGSPPMNFIKGQIIKENIYYFTPLIENQYVIYSLILLTIVFFILSLGIKSNEIIKILFLPFVILKKIANYY